MTAARLGWTLTFILSIVLFLILYKSERSSEHFKRRLDEMETRRQHIQDSVKSILIEYQAREKVLNDAIQKNLQLIEDINNELTRHKLKSSQLQIRIQKQKQEIERLWNSE